MILMLPDDDGGRRQARFVNLMMMMMNTFVYDGSGHSFMKGYLFSFFNMMMTKRKQDHFLLFVFISSVDRCDDD